MVAAFHGHLFACERLAYHLQFHRALLRGACPGTCDRFRLAYGDLLSERSFWIACVDIDPRSPHGFSGRFGRHHGCSRCGIGRQFPLQAWQRGAHEAARVSGRCPHTVAGAGGIGRRRYRRPFRRCDLRRCPGRRVLPNMAPPGCVNRVTASGQSQEAR